MTLEMAKSEIMPLTVIKLNKGTLWKYPDAWLNRWKGEETAVEKETGGSFISAATLQINCVGQRIITGYGA